MNNEISNTNGGKHPVPCSLLKDKIGVVTGSTRGIGFAIAREFAENNGATIIVCSRIKEQAIKAAEQIKGKVFVLKLI